MPGRAWPAEHFTRKTDGNMKKTLKKITDLVVSETTIVVVRETSKLLLRLILRR